MTTPQPFSLRIFVVASDSDGMRQVAGSNWIGKALVFPGKRYPEVRNRSEFEQTVLHGRIEWKTCDGQTLKQLQEAQAAE
jgi:hypothetical protein